jgi:fibronectin-binding autotransporter adhesin
MTQISLQNAEQAEITVKRRRFAKPPMSAALGAVACFLSLGASGARAQTTNNWIGGTGTWNVGTNWSAGIVPNDGGGVFYDVNISGLAAQTITFDAPPTVVDTLSLSSQQTLQDNGTAVSLTVGDPTSPYANTGSINNQGTINWGNGATLTAGAFVNDGVVSVGGGGSTLQTQSFSQSGTTTIANGGTITTGDFSITGGTVQGSGTINAASTLTLSGGKLQPGLPGAPGALTLNGLYNQTGGVFSEQIAGANSYGVLNLNGGVTLSPAASLNINFLNGFTPAIGTTFGIVNSSAGIFNGVWGNAPQGSFQLNGLSWTIDYGNISETQIALTFHGIDFPVTNMGVLNISGQTVSQPLNRPLVNPGVINVQNTSSVTLIGNVTNTGTINTGNAPGDSGSNLIVVTGVMTNVVTGNINLNAPGDKMTVGGGSSNAGSLVVTDGAQFLANGSYTNGGLLAMTGQGLKPNFAPVTINGNLTNTGSINVDASCDPNNFDCVSKGGMDNIEVVENLLNSGQITAGEAFAYALMAVGPLDNLDAVGEDPSFYNLSGSSVRLMGPHDSVEVSNGSFFNRAGASLAMSGVDDEVAVSNAFSNRGTVTLSAHGDVIIASSFTNAGTVSVGAGARIDARGAGGYSQTGGLTEGAGEIRALRGGVTIVGGKIMPGGPHEPGTLTVDGNYTQGSHADLVIDISGAGSGDFSVLDVLGAASLDGRVTFDFGFTPTADEAFTFLVADGGLSGAFSSDAFDGFACSACTLSYDALAGTVTLDINGSGATVTPELSSWVLMSVGALGLMAIGRRKRTARIETNLL